MKKVLILAVGLVAGFYGYAQGLSYNNLFVNPGQQAQNALLNTGSSIDTSNFDLSLS